MIDLLIYIYTQLKTVHSGVYKEYAPEAATFPYVVYSLPASNTDELEEDFILEVDVWDNNPDTTQIETITSNIDNLLNRSKHIETSFYCKIEKINRMMLPDTDPTIRRRQLRYQINTQFR